MSNSNDSGFNGTAAEINSSADGVVFISDDFAGLLSSFSIFESKAVSLSVLLGVVLDRISDDDPHSINLARSIYIKLSSLFRHFGYLENIISDMSKSVKDKIKALQSDSQYNPIIVSMYSKRLSRLNEMAKIFDVSKSLFNLLKIVLKHHKEIKK